MEQRKVSDSIRVLKTLLYIQGLWPEDASPTLDFYLQFYRPWLARRLVRHRFLRSSIRICRNSYPWAMIALNAVLISVVLPVDTYQQWHDKIIVAENVCSILEFTFGIATIVAFLNKEKLKVWIDIMEQLPSSFDDRELKGNFVESKMEWFCHSSIKFLPKCVGVCVTLGTIIHVVVDLLPERKFLMRGWYPYNEFASPAYEITLFIIAVHKVCVASTITTLLGTAVFMLNHIGVYFKILSKMLKNVRISSINKIRKRARAVVRKTPDNYIIVRTFANTEAGGVSESNSTSVNHTQIEIEPDSLALLQPVIEFERKGNTHKPVRTPRPIQVHRSRRVCQTKPHNKAKRTEQIRKIHNKILDTSFDELYGEIPADELDVEMQKNLRNIIQIHQTLLSSSLEVCPTFNFLMFVLYATSVVAATGATLFASNAENFGMKEAFLAVAVTGQPIAFCFFSYLANFITVKHDCFIEAAYECDWIASSRAFKTYIQIIMVRTNRPLLVLNPPGLYPLSLELLGQVSIRAYKMINSLTSIMT